MSEKTFRQGKLGETKTDEAGVRWGLVYKAEYGRAWTRKLDRRWAEWHQLIRIPPFGQPTQHQDVRRFTPSGLTRNDFCWVQVGSPAARQVHGTLVEARAKAGAVQAFLDHVNDMAAKSEVFHKKLIRQYGVPPELANAVEEYLFTKYGFEIVDSEFYKTQISAADVTEAVGVASR